MDGVERVRPVLRVGHAAVTVTVAEEHGGIALLDSRAVRSEVDDHLVHADPADSGTPIVAEPHLETTAERARDPVRVADRKQRHRRVVRRHPRVP